MGYTSKYFKSVVKAYTFAKRVSGTVKDISQGKVGTANYRPNYKVTFETWGQSQDAKHIRNDYQDDFDFDGYTHTSQDI